MTLFKGKYRIESIRLPQWDYGQAGYYYVTICTKDRACFFGDVIQDDVELTRMGEIVAEEWLETENVRLNVELDEWIIMPSHVHLILVITFQILNIERPNQETAQRGVSHTPTHLIMHRETPQRGVSHMPTHLILQIVHQETPQRGVSTHTPTHPAPSA